MMRRASDACRLAMRAADVSGRATSCATPSTSSPARGWSASRCARRGSSGPGSGESRAEAHAEDVALSLDILPWGSLPTQIAVAAGVATFWRGAWYVMDGCVFPDDTASSAAASAAAGVAGLVGVQRVAAPAVLRHALNTGRPIPPNARYALLYGLGLSCVAVWRGTWLAWDAAHERLFLPKGSSASDSPTVSGFVSHVTAVVGLSYFGYVSSVLAPPAVCLLLNDDALRKRDCESSPQNARDARRAFLRGATWLFKKAPK
jgi:hypothetical protein